MKQQVTFGHILTILSVIIIPLLIWGVNVERRFEKVIDNSEEINTLKRSHIQTTNMIHRNHIELRDMLHEIQLQLKDKADR